MQRRTLIRAGLAAPAAVSLAGLSRAQDAAGYPNRAVTIVVPFAAGGSADVIVRAMAVEMGRAWGQNVIVDNRAGGNTIIATSYVVSAPPDGYTILCGSYAWVTNQYLVAKLPYTPAALAPVTLLGEYPEMLFLRGDIPASNVAELAAYARSQGKPLNFANSGPGSSLHLAAAGFADAANIPAIHVPYRGSAPAMQDLVGGRIDAMFEGLSFKPFADGKRVKAMFVAQPESLAEWPELPTSRQAGLDGFRMASWFGLLVPAKTLDAIQQRISQAVVAALQKPAIDAQLRKLGLIPAPGTPAEYTAFLDRERTKLQAVISRNRIVID